MIHCNFDLNLWYKIRDDDPIPVHLLYQVPDMP